MVFSTTNLFKGIPCPEGGSCALTNCIYGHDLPLPTKPSPPPRTSAATDGPEKQTEQTTDTVKHPVKKRRITYELPSDRPLNKADLIHQQLAAERKPKGSPPPSPDAASKLKSVSDTVKPLPSLHKPVSPPLNGKATSPPATGKISRVNDNNNNKDNSKAIHQPQPTTCESLNPRLIPNDPAGHARRSLYLKHLHGEMARLNDQVSQAKGLKFKKALHLTDLELIKLALNEEERMAREQSSLYGNVIKQRIALLKKWPLDDWVKYVKDTYQIGEPAVRAKNEEKPIETGLKLSEEVLILPHLVADQKQLTAFGYIPTPPTPEQAAEAAAAVEASKNYEICDRCAARFQVFPDRNEEGKLTSRGPCEFHPNRKVFPPRSKTDKETGQKEPYYPCCGEKVGAPGCTTHEDHVFKSSSPARLAAVLPFMVTPENDSPARDGKGQKVKAVTFDCEMGYTVFGLELIRLTAVAWPTNEELLDILVRPLGTVIDLNSRFSGVFPEHFRNAVPYDEWKSQSSPKQTVDPDVKQLPLVENPQCARELLCRFLTPTTPLLGHAIDNDLNAVRLCHPTIIDTITLYPHPRGLPLRFGLRMLTQKHLNRYIQTGGERGHDSLEDAVATGDLVRIKVGEKWKVMRFTGWKFVDHELIAPVPREESDAVVQSSRLGKELTGSAAGVKRSRESTPDSKGGSTDGDTGVHEVTAVSA